MNNAAFDVTIPKDLGVSCAAVRDCVILPSGEKVWR
jgi:hypothetical protein